MPSTLVVYYSRTGYTRRAAEAVAAALDADIEAITEPRGRGGLWGFLRSAREALTARSVEIAPVQKEPSGYGLVIVATPVWAGHLASPVRGWLAAHGQQMRRTAFVCTERRSGAEQVLQEMTTLSARPPEATMAVTDAQIRSDGFGELLQRFCGRLQPQQPA